MVEKIRKFEKIIKEMAQEIADLRRECDLEWGEYDERNYNVENIIKEYKEEYGNE